MRCGARLIWETNFAGSMKVGRKHGRAQVQMRVGIFSGPAVAGCIGSTDRLEFTVMGNTVNTAARLESFDKDYASDDLCRILIGTRRLNC